MERMTIPCDPRNYGGQRQQPVEYLVIHYTAGDGDTARDNGLYFSRNAVGASAHWFVDEQWAVLSVPESRIAWHCGSSTYVHPRCRNGNSIGIELCSRKDPQGAYYFSRETVENGAVLTRELMRIYGIRTDHVIRHYDVTGKNCPAPFVDDGQLWEQFLEAIMRYQNLEAVPAWGRATAEKLITEGLLQGDGQGLDLSRDMLRLLVILDRAGLFGTANAQ